MGQRRYITDLRPGDTILHPYPEPSEYVTAVTDVRVLGGRTVYIHTGASVKSYDVRPGETPKVVTVA